MVTYGMISINKMATKRGIVGTGCQKVWECFYWIMFLAFVVFSSQLWAGEVPPSKDSLTFTKNAKSVSIQGKSAEKLITALRIFLESCSVDSTGYAASEQKWKELMTSSRRLHYVLPENSFIKLKLCGEKQVEVEEIILPLPEDSFPDHIYIKNKHEYSSYAKYHPSALRRIVASPVIGLISESRYASLRYLPEEGKTQNDGVTEIEADEKKLPFYGTWFVLQGGDTLNVNQHMRLRAQWYGIDFMKVAGTSGRELSKNSGKSIEDFYSWGEKVLSPAKGKILKVVTNLPDNPLGTKDPAHPLGNCVVLKTQEDHFIFVAHMRKDSVVVKEGQNVRLGDLLGHCGNSGNSDYPHIHLHMQNTPTLNQGLGLNFVFDKIHVELNGKKFSNVSWPLIRGLFVSNE